MIMEVCYAWMCLEWGKWKADEYFYTADPVGPFLFIKFLFHTALAPITATVDLFRRVK